MERDEMISRLDDAKNLLDAIYYHFEQTGEKPWARNSLTTIDLLIIELIKELEGE